MTRKTTLAALRRTSVGVLAATATFAMFASGAVAQGLSTDTASTPILNAVDTERSADVVAASANPDGVDSSLSFADLNNPAIATPMTERSEDEADNTGGGESSAEPATETGNTSASGDGDGTRPEHRPGVPGDTVVKVPSDLTMEVEGKSVPHPCAGRDLLYQTHVDATYVTRSHGELTVMAVNGSEVMPSDAVCMRLAPDANNGTEVSRIVVRDDPEMRFLGNPGRILWNAPQHLYPGWKPLWAGFGAFDPAHEWEVPTDFVGNVIKTELVDFEGPGEMEVFNLVGDGVPRRYFSSTGPRALYQLVGSHGHTDWTFSEAGIYKLTWKASGRHLDGTVEESKPIVQYWLVGPDEAVGFPKGTTKNLSSISFTAEQQREQLGLKEPQQPKPDRVDIASEPEKANPEEIASALEWYGNTGNTVISSGEAYAHYTLKDSRFAVDAKDTTGKSYTAAPIIEVPDSTLTCVAEGDANLHYWSEQTQNKWMWLTPAKGDTNAASYGVDMSAVDYSALTAQKAMFDNLVNGPHGARVLIGLDREGALMPITDTGSQMSRAIQMFEPTKYPLRYGFSKPGVYVLNSSVSATIAHGQPTYSMDDIVFVVGNEAINALRQKNDPKATLLPVGSKPQCTTPLAGADASKFPEIPSGTDPVQPDPGTPDPGTPDPEQPDPVTPDPGTNPDKPDPTQPGDGGAEQPVDPETRAVREALHEAWGEAMPNVLIQRGHMDMAAADSEQGIETYLHDTAVPGQDVKRPSGSFAFAVGRNAHSAHPLAELVALAPEYAKGVWTLPQTQEKTLPWLGFSTELVNYENLSSPMTVSITDFKGPGRMMTGHQDLGKTISISLDSAHPEKTMEYPVRSHDHQNFWFSAPGVYTVDFTYSWVGHDGAPGQTTLRTYFLVGDVAVKEGMQAINTQTLPSIDNGKDDGNTGGEDPDPGKPEPGKPDPGKPAPTDPSDGNTTPEKPKPQPPTPQQPGGGNTGGSGGAAPTPPPAVQPISAPGANGVTPIVSAPPPSAPLASAPVANATLATGNADTAEGDATAKSEASEQLSHDQGAGDAVTTAIASTPNHGSGSWMSQGWIPGFVLGVGVMSFLFGIGLIIAAAMKAKRGAA